MHQKYMSQDFRMGQEHPANLKAQTAAYDREKHRKDSINRMSVSLTQKECCICMDSKPDAVIMECGHGGICYECGKQMIA